MFIMQGDEKITDAVGEKSTRDSGQENNWLSKLAETKRACEVLL